MIIENFKKTFNELYLLLHVHMYSIGNDFYNVIRKILNFYKIRLKFIKSNDHFVKIIGPCTVPSLHFLIVGKV